MYNPRFPHRLKVLRPETNESGYPVVDPEGNPSYQALPLDIVVMDGERPRTDGTGRFVTTQSEEISFGYRTSSKGTSTGGDVVVCDFKIALPMFTTELRVGDILQVTDYDRTFLGSVLKKMTFNFGSNIWFNEIRN